jgi:hypothetical protein
VSGWWYLAGALFIISTVVWRRTSALLSAANPSARLPWVGWPPNRPSGIKRWQFLGCYTGALAVSFAADAAHDRSHPHLYDVLWGIPVAIGILVVGMAIPYQRHNRRVRRAAA